METIVHISDLHLSTKEARSNLESLQRTFLDMKPRPKLLIVSGDLLDHPTDGFISTIKGWFRRSSQITYDLKSVKADLEKLAKCCGPDCQFVVVPGNHDCRDYGVVANRNMAGAFNETFSGWKSAIWTVIGSREVVIFKVDSNTNNAQLNAARGKVGKLEFQHLHREVQRMRAELNENRFESALKIVVVHHHPLPIADSEERPFFKRDGFLGLDDAGIFLREMATHNIDIVLHGHKHHPFNSRIEINYNNKRRGLAVIAAGSATKNSEAERSFNLLKVSAGYVNGQLWKQTSGPASWTQSEFPIISYDRYLARRFEDGVADKKRYFESVELTYSLSAEGDSDLYSIYRGLITTEESLASMRVGRECSHGTLSDFGWRAFPDSYSEIRFEGKTEPGLVDGVVKFTPPLSPAFKNSYQNHCRMFNSFALTQEQRQRMAGPEKNSEEEFVHVDLVTPIKFLLLAVDFSKISLPGTIKALAIENRSQQLDHSETARCRHHLRVCHVTKVATLSLSNPLLEIEYRIIWKLPPAPPARYHDSRFGQSASIRSSLLRLSPQQNALTSLLHGEAFRLASEYTVNPDDFEFGIMVFDQSTGCLRFVAGRLKESTWKYTLCEGQGIGGRAHKLERAFFVNTQAQAREYAYLSPPLGGMLVPAAIIAIPIRYPFITPNGEGDTVAVVLISTYSNSTRLMDVCASEEASHFLIGYIQYFFMKEILPALGLKELLQPRGSGTGSASDFSATFSAQLSRNPGVSEYAFKINKSGSFFTLSDLKRIVEELRGVRDRIDW